MDSTAIRLYRWYALPGTTPIPQQEGGLLSRLASTGSMDALPAMPQVSEWMRGEVRKQIWRGPVRARPSRSLVIP